MQIYIILLVMGLLIGTTSSIDGLSVSPAWRLFWLVGPYGLLMVLSHGVCLWGRHGLERHPERATRLLTWTDRLLNLVRWGTLGYYFVSIFELGLLTWLMEAMDGWQLPAQAALIGPPLAVAVAGWWSYYPIDRRLRESALIRRVDEGKPIWPIWTRRQYLLSQVRHQMLLLMGPLLLLLGWWQVVQALIRLAMIPADAEPILLAGGAALIFFTAPLIVRFMWDTEPMPDGPVRQSLLELCRSRGIRVRQLLLWHTYGGMINGAVMGLVGRLRYILLTDGLLEQMETEHIEAVMAHELGHIKKHHMPGLFLCALGSLSAIYLLAESTLWAVVRLGQTAGWLTDGLSLTVTTDESGGAAALLVTAATILLWAVAFGYISRRFERQADTFAVQHLSARHDRIADDAVRTMTGALQAVATLNNISTRRKSWRHGSIDWRCEYLESLVGLPVDHCPIDRQIRRICWLCAALLVVTGLLEWLTASQGMV